MKITDVNINKSKRVLNVISNDMFNDNFDELDLIDKDKVLDYAVAHDMVIYDTKDVETKKIYKVMDQDIVYNAFGMCEYSINDGEEDIICSTYEAAVGLAYRLFFDSYGYFIEKHNIQEV